MVFDQPIVLWFCFLAKGSKLFEPGVHEPAPTQPHIGSYVFVSFFLFFAVCVLGGVPGV